MGGGEGGGGRPPSAFSCDRCSDSTAAVSNSTPREDPEVGETFRLLHGKRLEVRHTRRRWECLHTHTPTHDPPPPGSQVFSGSASRRCHAAIAPTRLAASQRAPPSLRQNSSGASAVSLRSPDRQRGGDDSTPTGWRAGRTVCRDPGEQLREEPGGLLKNLLPI